MIVVMFLATGMMLGMILLVLISRKSSELRLQKAKIVIAQTERKELLIQLRELYLYIKENHKLQDKKLIGKGKKLQKKVNSLETQIQGIKNGRADFEDVILLPGYSLLWIFHVDATNTIVKKLRQMCIQVRQRKDAMDYAFYLLAYFLGFACMGIWSALTFLALCMAMDLGTRAMLVSIIVFALFLLVGYIPLNDLGIVVKKRSDEIERQFPQAISKMTLLIVAGQEINQSWRITSANTEGVLYEEMRRVTLDTDNNVQPAEAYTRFMDRCNNPYTTKLATAILQNISKGNAEIVKVFRRLNEESWSERKHSARRYAEVVQTKLLIPTLLMFAGIILMVIVPVMSGFNVM